MKVWGDSQGPNQLHPGTKVYGIAFRAGGRPLNSGEKIGSARSLSVLLSIVAVSGGSIVLSLARREIKIGSFLPVYHPVLHLLTERALSVFGALGRTNQKRFVGRSNPNANHLAPGGTR